MNSVIVMTQTSNYSQDGLSIVHKPLIKIEPLSFNLDLLKLNYDWILFSSKNAVKYFYPYLQQTSYRYIAVIGKKTKAYCEDQGIAVDFCPNDYSQEGFLADFQASAHAKILVPSSQAAQPLLVDTLRDRGLNVTKIDLYKPSAWSSHVTDIDQLLAQHKVGAITFASSSAVNAFFNRSLPETTKAFSNIYAIGQQTLSTIQQYGVEAKVADEQTLDGLIEKVKESWM
ncbi:uroporphyrinogen-III synthase [Staphylococcus argensis]|uniref:Uroporphyrinogen-III synthase n=1 Tax=Staphylococcus argensis TaxID=1607738 RepID=A0A2K4FFP9_9STAP|nr:uroporphyrinogen-III synthase [Staphylococcus argensis]MCY6990670.1 uroporphyrinogen-III synthase [Staphylococcus argensis]POA10172.1 uroporphyrinogen III synthase [Staphylococcus argensis]